MISHKLKELNISPCQGEKGKKPSSLFGVNSTTVKQLNPAAAKLVQLLYLFLVSQY